MDFSQITDPFVWGWLMVGANAMAALCLLIAARGARQPEETPEVRRLATPWLVAGLMMAALAVHKQLDIFAFLGEQLRRARSMLHWSIDDQLLQTGLIMLVTLIAMLTLFAARRSAREMRGSYRLLLVGLLLAWLYVGGSGVMDAHLPWFQDLPVQAWVMACEALAAGVLLLAGTRFLVRARTRARVNQVT